MAMRGTRLGPDAALRRVRELLLDMGLNEYQASALAYLIYLGETKATTLSRASGVPTSRIYDVLNELVRRGLVVVRPGRPALYRARDPEDIASALKSEGIRELKERLAELEKRADEFVKLARQVYMKGPEEAEITPLLRIVSVGSTSLEETRRLYKAAKEEILIISKGFQYYPDVADALCEAVERGVKARVVLVDPKLLSEDERRAQEAILRRLLSDLDEKVEVRFFPGGLPLRGCIIDPEREEGRALFLVEEPGIPFFLREAAITRHYSLVRALALMFKLIWERARPAEI